MPRDRDALITGIGLVSCLGEGVEAHWAALDAPGGFSRWWIRRASRPGPVHPMAPLELDKQIPKRGDQRQMEAWQRIGVYAAGLALDAAGVKGNAGAARAHGHDRRRRRRRAGLRGRTRRSCRRCPRRADPGALLNEQLLRDLRPTLFLAQLVQPAGRQHLARARRGRLVAHLHGRGGLPAPTRCASPARGSRPARAICSWSAARTTRERPDVLLHYEMGAAAVEARRSPAVWARQAAGGGMVLGSVGCFLVIESRAHAAARGARADGAHRRRSPPTAAAAARARRPRTPRGSSTAMRRHLRAGACRGDLRRLGRAGADRGGSGLPARAGPAGARQRRRRSATRWSRRFPPLWRLAAMAVARRPPVRAAGDRTRQPMDRRTAPGAGDLLGPLARRGAGPGRRRRRRRRMGRAG